MRKFGLAVFVLMFMSVVSSSAFAKPEKRFDQESYTMRELTFDNLRVGYKVFREVCKSCHSRGNDKGARFLHTESKTMRAWNRVFSERYPKCAANGAWKSISNDDLAKLNDYLFANAVDTVDANCYL